MKTITRSQYLQLTGLLFLAAEHNKQFAALEKAIAQITGEPGDHGYYGHSSDAASSNYSADQLLEKLVITVVEDVTP